MPSGYPKRKKVKMMYYSTGSLTLRVCERLNIQYKEALEIIQKYAKLEEWGKEHLNHDQVADKIAEAYKNDRS